MGGRGGSRLEVRGPQVWNRRWGVPRESERKREGGRRGEGGGKAERIHAFYIQMAPKKSLPSTLTLKHC